MPSDVQAKCRQNTVYTRKREKRRKEGRGKAMKKCMALAGHGAQWQSLLRTPSETRNMVQWESSCLESSGRGCGGGLVVQPSHFCSTPAPQ
ncbi:hypothetical protein LEMLEM_LOCUS23309 [Lemmus lemmus]